MKNSIRSIKCNVFFIKFAPVPRKKCQLLIKCLLRWIGRLNLFMVRCYFTQSYSDSVQWKLNWLFQVGLDHFRKKVQLLTFIDFSWNRKSSIKIIVFFLVTFEWVGMIKSILRRKAQLNTYGQPLQRVWRKKHVNMNGRCLAWASLLTIDYIS